MGFYLDSEAAGAIADLTGGSAYSSRCLVRTRLSMRSLGAVGVPHSPKAFEWAIRSSIQEHLSLGLQGPQHLVEIVHRRSIRESPRTTGDTGALLRPATVLIAVLAGGVFCTSRRGVGPVEPGPSGQPTGRGGNCLESDEEDAAPPDPEVNLPRFGLLVRWRDGEIG